MIDEPLKWSHFIDTSRTNAAAAAAAAAAVNLSSFSYQREAKTASRSCRVATTTRDCQP